VGQLEGRGRRTSCGCGLEADGGFGSFGDSHGVLGRAVGYATSSGCQDVRLSECLKRD